MPQAPGDLLGHFRRRRSGSSTPRRCHPYRRPGLGPSRWSCHVKEWRLVFVDHSGTASASNAGTEPGLTSLSATAVTDRSLTATPAPVKRRKGSPAYPSTTTLCEPLTWRSSFRSPSTTRASMLPPAPPTDVMRASKSSAVTGAVPCASAWPGAPSAPNATAMPMRRRHGPDRPRCAVSATADPLSISRRLVIGAARWGRARARMRRARPG